MAPLVLLAAAATFSCTMFMLGTGAPPPRVRQVINHSQFSISLIDMRVRGRALITIQPVVEYIADLGEKRGRG
jgi:hypothetical protein